MYVRNLIRLHIYQVKPSKIFFSKTFASVEHVTNTRRHLIESYIKVLPLEFKRH